MVKKTKEKIEEFYKTYPGYLKRSNNDGLFLLNKRFPKTNFKLEDVSEIRKQFIKKIYSNVKFKDRKHKQKIFVKDFPKTPNNLKFKRLYWDLETSYNVVSTWNIGYKINIFPENIIKERAIICICYKFEGEDKVYSLQWNKGDDGKMIKKFIDILNSADENITHNGLRFDLPWLRTRALANGVSMWPQYSSLDTLKIARAGFKFNSNKLDYLSRFMGYGGKSDTGGFKLWQDIIEKNDPQAMKLMIEYCKNDVIILEKVHQKLSGYANSKTHVGVTLGENKCSCPHCGSEERRMGRNRITASGTIYKQFQCKDCNKYYQVSLMAWNSYSKLNMKKLKD